MTETQLLILVKNLYEYLQEKCMGKKNLLFSKCGLMKKMEFHSITPPVTWWVLTQFLKISFYPSLLMTMNVFDPNEFIELNQGPGPDMGLNFQQRKA